MRSSLVLAAFALLGCAAPNLPPAPPPKSPVVAPSTFEWRAKLDRDHPLVGKIWDVKAGDFVEPERVIEEAAKVPYVLLGERHDNPDHHRLQARVVAELVKAVRHPQLVLEMLELEQQPAIDSFLAQPGASAAGFGAALGWEKTSWPAFADYQPIFEAAFAAKLPIKAGNIAQADAKALVKQGPSALAPERAQALSLDRAFPSALEAALVDELRASHCGKLPESLLAPMALAQHARDAQMAQVLGKAGPEEGAVLIAGGGHARLDRGVPYYLALATPAARVVSVGFREVRHADRSPSA
ncbi:MAG TPA: ChaN family lipoprotein, partial [Polyangiales bacterium]|nr:ChaN family lipoprotein [Polyangiales bacterium]